MSNFPATVGVMSREAMRYGALLHGLPVPLLAVDFSRRFDVEGIRCFVNQGSRNYHGRVVGSDVTSEVRNGRWGAKLGTTTSANRLSFDSADAGSAKALTALQGVTCVCVVTPLRQGAGLDVMACGRWNTGGTPGSNAFGIGLNFAVTSTDYKAWWAVDVGGTINQVVDPTAWSTNDRLVLIGRRDGTSLTLHKNGVQVASGSCAAGDLSNPTMNFLVGELGAGGGFNTNAFYETIYLFDRSISLKHVAMLSQRPTLLFESDEPSMRSGALAAGGGGPGPSASGSMGMFAAAAG